MLLHSPAGFSPAAQLLLARGSGSSQPRSLKAAPAQPLGEHHEPSTQPLQQNSGGVALPAITYPLHCWEQGLAAGASPEMVFGTTKGGSQAHPTHASHKKCTALG